MRPLPYRQSERLVRLYSEFPNFPGGGLKKFWISGPEYLELKRESYSLSGTLMETDLFTNYKDVDGRYVPLLQKFTDEVEKGRTSLLEIRGIAFSKVDDYKFDKSYLESLSK